MKRTMNRTAGLTAAVTIAGVLLLMILPGCGGSRDSHPTVVTPPPPDRVDTTTPTSDDPPGKLEMPKGEIEPPAPAESKPSQGGIEMPKTSAPPVESGVDASPVSVQYATWDEIHQTVTSTGRITVVDIWSLACEPCLKEFPGLVRLHESFGSSIQCIGVDVDFDGRKSRPPEIYEDRVVMFLQSVNTRFPNYISSTPSDDVFAAAGLDSIPAVLVYDASGKLVKAFVDSGETAGFTYEEDVIPYVTKLAG